MATKGKLGKSLKGTRDEYVEVQPLGLKNMMGDSYRAKRLSDGKSVFIKMPHMPSHKSWSYFYVRERLARVFASLFAEFANFQRMKSLDCVARILDAGVTLERGGSDYPMLLPFLVQDFIVGQNVRDHLGKNFNGLKSEVWVAHAKAITRAMAQVHGRMVVHGDMHPGNIMLRRTQSTQKSSLDIVLIDFGQAFLADCALAAPEHPNRNPYNYYISPERRAGEHWDHSSDIYSIGGILYYLATGEDPTDAVTKSSPGAIVDNIRAKNAQLVQDFPAIGCIIAKTTAEHPLARYSSASELLREIEIFSGDRHHSALTSEHRKKISRIANPLMQVMTAEKLAELDRALRAGREARFELIGDRDTIIAGLLRYLSVLEAGDEYWTVTSPYLWSQDNLGFEGRFLAMNEVIARRGVRIKRLYQLTHAETSVAGDERELWDNIVRGSRSVLSNLSLKLGEKVAKERFDIRWNMVSGVGQQSLLRPDHKAVGLWVKGKSRTAISFGLSTDRRIQKVIFWTPPLRVGEAVLSDMRTRIDSGRALEEWSGDSAKFTAT